MFKTNKSENKQLLLSVTIKDCDVETFRAGGKGGQHQNKTESGVRIRHRESGAVGEARDTRSQLENKRAAFRRMAETEIFKNWMRMEVAKSRGEKTVDQIVDEQMVDTNLKIEIHNQDGKWEEHG